VVLLLQQEAEQVLLFQAQSQQAQAQEDQLVELS
jgi:hypothetical protein